jgi:preprotein translocase subunit SecF
MRSFFVNAHYDFLSKKRVAYMISATILIVGIAASGFWYSRNGSWLNYGVDFTGGSFIKVRIDAADVTAEHVRSTIGNSIENAQISNFGAANEFAIRTHGATTADQTAVAEQVMQTLRGEFGEQAVTSLGVEAVSAKVGGELQGKALMAILFSLLATLVYLAIRFEWRFGLAAVIATAHDILLTLGIIAMLHLDVSLPTVAALLTIVGYSLNDTVIIFDRIREHLRSAKKPDWVPLINQSINETLPRTILTVSTVLVTLLALFLFGGSVTRDFSLIMIIGIVLGTYSSMFIASSALLAIETRWPREVKTTVRKTTPASRPPARTART